MALSVRKDVVLITGGSGFLAQHLIKDMQQSCLDSITEIRVADRKPFKKFLDYPDHIPVKTYTVNCEILEELSPVLEGVDAVYHLCGSHFVYTNEAHKQKTWRDNYITTEVVVKAMKERNVEYVLFVSDAAAYTSPADYPVGDAEREVCPRRFRLGTYGQAKIKAELLLKLANGQNLPNGETLKAVIIRPTILHGEGDSWLVPSSIEWARTSNGVIPKFDAECIQVAYVGNCANMLIRTMKQLKTDPKQMGGEIFISNDGNSLGHINYFTFIQPYLQLVNCGVEKTQWNYDVLRAVSWLLHKGYSVFGIKRWAGFPNEDAMDVIGGVSLTFCSTKTRLLLDWLAPYDSKAALDRTYAWWKKNINTVLQQ